MKFRGREKKEVKRPESLLGKIWYFIWKDDSIWSWIVSLVLAFVLVKFIFFPVLSFIFNSSMPLVVVESTSMFHEGGALKDITGFGTREDFDEWWETSRTWYENNGITYSQADKWDFISGFDKGDIIVLYGTSNIKIGDIIVFEAGEKHPIIHRVVKIRLTENGPVYETKGDNNPSQLPIEKEIRPGQVIGKSIVKIPKLGWLKLMFVSIINFFKYSFF